VPRNVPADFEPAGSYEGLAVSSELEPGWEERAAAAMRAGGAVARVGCGVVWEISGGVVRVGCGLVVA
jgi:hypothetical protein